MVARDDLEVALRLSAQRQALQAFVAGDGLRQPFEHGLGHRAGVDILLAQGRGVNLPEFPSRCQVREPSGARLGPLGVRSLFFSGVPQGFHGVWHVSVPDAIHQWPRNHATLSFPDTECPGDGPLAGGPLHLRLN